MNLRKLPSGRSMLFIFALLIVMAPAAFGQSGIAGQVKDSTGAVLPGVSVGVSSPALIEGTRTTITDESGLYNIVNLRPGQYAETFTLPGFKVVKRVGIDIPTAYTATVNAELSVGAIDQAVTVEGESPLVDVRNSLVETVMNREVRDTIPTGRDPFSVGQIIPGVTTSTPDVGGTQIMQQPTLQVHGSSGNDNVYMVDSVQIQHIGFGGNQTGFYFNDGLMQEVGYQTNTLQAEAPVGGVQINIIPQEGGNAFHGSIFASGANNSMQSDNLDSNLVNLGFKKQNAVKSLYDLNATIGGPIAKDRLWFFYTVRRWSANNYLGNTFASNGSQAVDDQHITDNALRLTYQLSKRNKISLHYDRNEKFRGHRPNNWVSASINDPISDVVQTTQLNYIGEAKWTSTISNRLLAEASIFSLPVNYTLGFEPGVDPSTLAVYDQTLSTITGVSPRADRDSAQMFTYAGNISYVTGTHNFKAGYQVRTGWSQELFTIRGDFLEITNNNVKGLPTSTFCVTAGNCQVRLVNTPSGHKEDGTNTGIYFQDSWHIGRVTINPGVRYERFTMGIPAQSAPAGTWIGARTFAAQEGLVDWNTVSPRFGFSWDVAGNGLTAIKGGISRYDRLEGITLVQPLNLRNISFKTCPWDGSPITASFDQSKCSGSLQPTLGYVDSNLKRPHQWEYTAMIQRQIGSNTSVSVGYYGRRFGDLYTTVNALAPPSAYTPVTITNPLTNQPLTVYNQSAATKGLTQNVVTTIPSLGAVVQRRGVSGKYKIVESDDVRRLYDRQRLW